MLGRAVDRRVMPGVMRRGVPRRAAWARGTFVLGLALASVLLIPGVARAATCQQSAPANNSYTVNVCFTSPSDGSTATGQTSVSATVSVTGTSPGVRRMTFYLGGEHLLTDYQSSYTFTLPSDRFVDGSKTLEVEAWMRDGFISQRASVNLQFSNGVTTPPVNTNSFTPTSGTTPGAGQPFVVAAAGDGAGGEQSETDTTNLIASWNPNLFLYLGDVYEKGTVTEFFNWYRPTDSFYGRFRSITNPTIGNHEYENGQAPGYFDYWDNVPNYYSFNANGWHFISLNSNSAFNQTAPGTPQYDWLVNDLNQNSRPCTVAYFHHPLYNIGDEGSTMSLADWYSLFDQTGVDLVLVAHDHTYQRWQPLDASGNPDPNGVTQIVVGTGGHAIGDFIQSDPRVAATAQQFGAVRLELNPGGASYQFITDQGQSLDSGSVGCNGAASDTAAPSIPAGLSAIGSYKTRIDLSWTASSDNVGVSGYEIQRDGQPLATIGAQTTYPDNTVQPGSTHTYKVRALDAAGNMSEFSDPASATTPTVSVLFHDGFESGDLSNWTANNGLVAQQSQVFVGAYAAEAISNGSAGASAYTQLPQGETNLYYVARFKAVSQSQNVNLLRFRNSTVGANAMATLFVTSTNRIGLRNDVAGAAITSTTVAAPNQWHTAQVHLVVNGLSSQIEVWLDGTMVADLSQNGVNLGTNPLGRLELGDPSLSRTFDVAFDEVAYDVEFIPDAAAPTAATNLTASAIQGRQVDLSWTAGTDDVGISGYDVYRDETLVGSTGPATSYADQDVSPRTSYAYKVIAKDASGKVSPASNIAFVTTGDAFADDFELGNLSRWSTVSGLTVQQALVDRGQWAARATSDAASGGASAAVLLLGTPISEYYYRTRFQVVTQGANSVSLLRFRTPGAAAIASVFISSAGKLSYRNDTNSTFFTSAQSVSRGFWHEVQARVLVNGASSIVEVWLDGIQVVTQPESLGTSTIGRLELGDPDPSTGRSFDVVFDNVVADTAFIQDAARPTPPTNLHSTSVSPTQVDLAWDAGDDDVGVTGYNIYRNGAPLADVDGSTLTYSDTTAGAGAEVTYAVTALDAVGHESALSGTLVVTTSDILKPSIPGGLVATPVAGVNQINLSWTASTDNFGVTGYRVYRSDQQSAIGSVDGATTSYSDPTVAPVTAYTYTVAAFDAAGNESDPSDPATVTSADTVAPQPPRGLLAIPFSETHIVIGWLAGSDNVGVTGYRIYRDGSSTPVGSVNGSSRVYVDGGLLPGTTHGYTIKSVDAAGNPSSDSSSTTATTFIFYEGFETGNLSRWTGVSGLVAQSNVVASGNWAARATATGNTNAVRYAYEQLPATYQSAYYHVNFRIQSNQGSPADLLRLDNASGGSLVTLNYDAKRKLGYRNDVAGQSRLSSTTLNVGQWHSAIVRVVVSGASSRVDVWLNGNQVGALSRTEALGTTPIGRVELGDRIAGHKYDVAYDNVLVVKGP